MQETQEQPKTTSSKPGKRGDKYSRVKALPKTTGLLSSPGLGNPNIISHDSIKLATPSPSMTETESFISKNPQIFKKGFKKKHSDSKSLPTGRSHSKSLISKTSTFVSPNKSIKDIVPDYSTIQAASPKISEIVEDIPETHSVTSLVHSTRSMKMKEKKIKPFVWEDYLNNEGYSDWLIQHIIPEKFKEQVQTVFQLMNNTTSFQDLIHNFNYFGLDTFVTLFPNIRSFYIVIISHKTD